VSRLLNPDFTSSIENYDILVFQETKTDEFDQLLLPKDYSFRAKGFISQRSTSSL
jgi:hypothetical protein